MAPRRHPAPETIRHRRDFLACARARRSVAPAFVLQARRRGDDGPLRVGYTCSKKVGNAVTRNRAKRRLRAAAAEVLRTGGKSGWDYVLIGRREDTVSRPFPDLVSDLSGALEKVHRDRRAP